MVEEFKEVQTGADEVLSYDIDPEGVEEEEPKGLKRLFRAGPLVKAFPSWVGLSHVAKREAERDKKDGKTFGCSYEDIMKSHEVAKQKSPYPLPRSRVTGGAGQESEIPNFKASYLGRFPLVSADIWTSDHLSERSRSVDAFSGTRARGTLTLKRR